ncbi:MAG: hypothetical protein WAM97_04020 [Acidimicrobiales bacterium]
MPAPTAAIISFRLGGTDGVAIEAAKWHWALEQMGFRVSTVAGDGPVDHVIAGLAMDASEPPERSHLEDALSGADLVVVENMCSLPLNPRAGEAVADVLRSRPAVMHHHDLPWQRPQTALMPPPPDDPYWMHVTINELSRRELSARGIEASVLRNCFDTDPPPGDRDATRERIGVDPEELLVLQPTRAIPRKNVPGGIALAASVGATYWLLGQAEDGFGPELDRILSAAPVRVIRGSPEGPAVEMNDAYAACDVVAMPSFWEGFGNPTVESATHRRPLAFEPYPVALELLQFGFEWFSLDQWRFLAEWLETGDRGLLDRNSEVARRHFALTDLPDRIGALFARAGWIRW